jgi:hypothetical protein
MMTRRFGAVPVSNRCYQYFDLSYPTRNSHTRRRLCPKAMDEAILDDKRADQKDQILADLIEYCKLDTLAMVEIFRKLQEL